MFGLARFKNEEYTKYFLRLYKCISPMEHQSNKCNSTGTNRTIGTNGRVEWTPTQPDVIGNILSLNNKMHFTNGTPIE